MNVSNLPRSFAAYSKKTEERIASSSGGLFSLIASVVLNKHGVVYGVKMAEGCKSAVYAKIVAVEELAVLRGSKYIQATVGDTFKKVKEDLDSGIFVLFSGTGCQVNGLKAYLLHEYENLICLDVVCHGVPSPELWRRYTDYCESRFQGKIKSVNFRCKDDSCKDFYIRKILGETQVYSGKNVDPYMLMFLRNYALRPSCYNCTAKSMKLADISLSDFWGIQYVAKEMYDDLGVSLCIIRSDKGLDLFDLIKDDLVVKEIPLQTALERCKAEHMSAERPKERGRFYSDMHDLSFENLSKKYATPDAMSLKARIGRIVRILKKRVCGEKYRNRGYGQYGISNIFDTREQV